MQTDIFIIQKVLRIVILPFKSVSIYFYTMIQPGTTIHIYISAVQLTILQVIRKSINYHHVCVAIILQFQIILSPPSNQ